MEEVVDIESNETVNTISRWTYDLLIGWGAPPSLASYINLAVLLFMVIVLVYVLHFLVRGALRKGFRKITATTKLSFFGYLLKNRFAHYLALAVPLSLVKNSIPRFIWF
jgi:miniconductance mechanosensitive channel